MKTIIVSPVLFVLFLACNNEKEVARMPPEAAGVHASVAASGQLQAERKDEYQKVSPSVALYIEPGEQSPDIGANNAIITASGLPFTQTFAGWSEAYSIDETIKIYKKFVNDSAQNKYIQYFRQYESWLMITHYSLLGSKASTLQVKFLLNELIDTKYTGYPLIYYCTKYLADNNALTMTELGKINKSIDAYKQVGAQPLSYMEKDAKGPGGKPYPPSVIEAINKRIREKNETAIWVDKIKTISI